MSLPLISPRFRYSLTVLVLKRRTSAASFKVKKCSPIVATDCVLLTASALFLPAKPSNARIPDHTSAGEFFCRRLGRNIRRSLESHKGPACPPPTRQTVERPAPVRCGADLHWILALPRLTVAKPMCWLPRLPRAHQGRFSLRIPRGQVDRTSRINIGFFCPRVHAGYHSRGSLETQTLPRPTGLTKSSPARTSESNAR